MVEVVEVVMAEGEVIGAGLGGGIDLVTLAPADAGLAASVGGTAIRNFARTSLVALLIVLPLFIVLLLKALLSSGTDSFSGLVRIKSSRSLSRSSRASFCLVFRPTILGGIPGWGGGPRGWVFGPCPCRNGSLGRYLSAFSGPLDHGDDGEGDRDRLRDGRYESRYGGPALLLFGSAYT